MSISEYFNSSNEEIIKVLSDKEIDINKLEFALSALSITFSLQSLDLLLDAIISNYQIMTFYEKIRDMILQLGNTEKNAFHVIDRISMYSRGQFPLLSLLTTEVMIALNCIPGNNVVEYLKLDKITLLNKFQTEGLNSNILTALCHSKYHLSARDLIDVINKVDHFALFGIWGSIKYAFIGMGKNAINDLCYGLSLDNNFYLVKLIIETLVEMNDKSVEPYLVRLVLSTKDKDLQREAIEALGKIQCENSATILYEFIKTHIQVENISENELCETAVYSLSQLGEPGVEALQMLLTTKPKWLAEIVKNILSQNGRLPEWFSDERSLTNERLEFWYNVLFQFKGYSSLMSKNSEYLRKELSKFSSIFEPNEKKYGLFLPVLNTKWAIKSVYGVKKGAFVALNKRLLILDFEKKLYHSYRYEDISEVNISRSLITIKFVTGQDIILEMKLSQGLELFWMWSNILWGASGGFSKKFDEQFVKMVIAKGNIEKASIEINEMEAYMKVIFSFFVEIIEEDFE